MIHIEQIKPNQFAETNLLEKAALAALNQQGFNQLFEMTIVITDDKQLHQLNLQYLGVDSPTDVLSFPSDEIDPETGYRYLGDILLSLPRAALQAEKAGHTLTAELQLLVVHGVLHLLGHDHAEPEDKAKMWQAQANILKILNLAHIQIIEE